MADFAVFYPILRRFEGGYVNHPKDPGGETYAGIARAYNPDWEGWAFIDKAKQKLQLPEPVPVVSYLVLNNVLAPDAPLQASIRTFYKPRYWDVLRLDEVRSQALANQLADHSASAGPSRPARMIQFALNRLGVKVNNKKLVEDGKVGPLTVAAINAADPGKLLAAFVQLRRDHYEYRAGARTPDAEVLKLLRALKVVPDATQKVFLKSWLARLPK